MSDKNSSSPNKKVFNPILNVSVTGATIDEFTQNAILCPVPETQPEILEQIPLDNPSDSEPTENIPSFYNQYQPNPYQDNPNQFSSSSSSSINNNPLGGSISPGFGVDNSQPHQTDSNYNSSNPTSGLLSSFTSILSFGGAQKKKETFDDKPPVIQSAVEQLLSSSGESNANPVPLFNPSQTNFGTSTSPGLPINLTTPLGPPPPPPSIGGNNTYRRQTQKKLTYAPIPGFSSNPLQPPIQNPGASIPPDQKPSIFSPTSVDPIPNQNLPPVLNKTPPPNFPPPPSTNYPPPPQTSYFQKNPPPSVFSEIITTTPIPITPDVETSTSLNTIPSSIAELNTSWTPPISTRTTPRKPPSYWSPPSAPPPAPIPTQNVETSSNTTSINFFAPPVVTENPTFLPEVKSPFLIPEVKPANFLIPTTEVHNLDSNTSSYFSGFVMSNTSNDSRPAVQATLNTSAATIRSVSPMAGVDGAAADAATKPNAPPYRPVYHHWFHKKEIEGRILWIPFSMVDSLALEAAFVSTDIHPEHMVAVDGGRYDVNILRRQRICVYWEGAPTEVRRCSWFFKGNNDGRFTPYEENIATKLEDEYKAAYEVNQWHRKVDLPSGETVIFQAPDILVLFPQSAGADVWNTTPSAAQRPRVVKRGMDEFDIDEGEPTKIDHLLFLVHGIGSVCDLKFRSVEEVVDDFRCISLQLVQSHYKTSCEQGIANRIEVLPVGWHNHLHSEDTGIDKKLKSITLESIPKLRDFTNDTLLDILFYTSPVYCQTIISAVGSELNRIYDLFKSRNPGFKGSISLGGHSLGSVILFDILCHQHPPEKEETKEKEETVEGSDEDQVPPMRSVAKPPPHQRRLSRRISYMMGTVGTGQPQITYPHLNFQPIAFFALGSPIGMFVTVRGLDSLGEQFALPTCPGFFNIFHPYDPVAYRIESLINSDLGTVRPVLIPHHKGRKRMHLELKETMARVGADLKQRIMDSMKNTWNSVYQFTMFHRQDPRSLEAEVDKVFEEQMIGEDTPETEESSETDLPVGILNNGRRIDYVLQEAPFEFFNEYIFALTSHVCYWESEDTMLLILKEIYSSMGIQTDNKIPQQTMSIERASPSPLSSGGPPRSLQMADPLRPMVYNSNPPSSGFIRKT